MSVTHVSLDLSRKRTSMMLVMGVLISAALAAVVLSGCEPPSPTSKDSGHRIIKVQPPDPKAEFYKTVTLDNGLEAKQSLYPVGKFGGTYYESMFGSGPKTFNPIVSSDATSSRLSGLMFDGLLSMNAYSGEMTPHLAKTVEILPDQKTYIVTLRQGLQWSDGHPITADDVVFTWNQLIKTGLGNPSSRDVVTIDGHFPEVSKRDNLTIVFKTYKPFAPFKINLSQSILPKHIIAPIIRKNSKNFDSFWGVNTPPKHFVGSGPYLLDEYMTGQRVIFKRNPKYFMVNTENKRLPYIERYVFEIVNDQNAEKLLFEQGRVDQLGVPGKDVFYIKHLISPDFTLYDLGPTTSATFLTFNQNPRKNKDNGKPYVNPVKLAWFRNLKFRQAVDYAIQRNEIVNNILQGVGAPLFTPEPLSSIFLNQALAKGHAANIDKARQLLKEAGFKWDAQKRLVDASGHRVEFEMMTNTGNLEREAVGVSVKEDLERLGMKVNFRPIDFNVLVGRIDSCNWEGIILGLTGGNTEPNQGVNVWRHDGAMHLFNSRKPDRDMPGTDIIEPWERQLDQLFASGATTLDMAERRKHYDAYQQVVVDNLPFIYLYSGKQILAMRNHIHNVDPTPLGGLIHNFESLWLENKKP